jgi:hypothetical protein
MKKWITSIVVFILSFAVTAFVGFYSAIFLAGPHSDVLPEILQFPVGLFLLILIIGIPVWLSIKTFMKFKMKES